ncbi:sugar kinase [Bacillus horti]|uniref:2-dehydro-3-deoxygluconokinase n=1 Tax=Caldalkalibacillus horti TaxID=77523 RepID=A0ABT9VVF6_9BACI|nr:sugar kinase [Bacillus horti]MDQ0164978.1 2-dehydro-3-deoxygluconokinase [Bacillus horti]
MDVVTFGETMVVLSPLTTGPLRYVQHFEKTIGGAESNVAIGLVRLGHQVSWISRLGEDEFGIYTRNFIRGEGVDTSAVMFDKRYPTGVFFKERQAAQDPKVYYYRAGSAASQMTPEDIQDHHLKDAKILHLTGITPALSESCRETVLHSIALARKHQVKVVFDPNIRLKLWSKAEAQKTLFEMASLCDVVLPGIDEGELLTGETEPEAIAEALRQNGASVVVVKLGAEGAYFQSIKESGYASGVKVEHIVDTIGAGDGFAAGLLSGFIRGWSLSEAVALGNRVGAFALTVAGDVEGYPYWSQLEQGKENKQIHR